MSSTRPSLTLVVVALAWMAPGTWAMEPGLSEEAVASAGCGRTTGGSSSALQTLLYGGLERQYRVHLPPAFDGSTPRPLLLSFHGYTGSAEFSELQWTGLSEHADEEGYVVVYPQSTGFEAELSGRNTLVTSWNDLACNASPGPAGPTCSADADPYPCPPECGECGPCNWCSCHDDVGFVAALLDHLESTLCLDKNRLRAVGFSNGGMFVQRLGCALGDRLQGVAPWGGTLAKGFSCAPEAGGTSLLLLSGTEDRTVPLDGSRADDGYFYTPNADVAKEWASTQGCSATATPVDTPWSGTAALACVEHRDCRNGSAVMSCQWKAAHDWPKLEDGVEGTTDFGNRLLWWFFER
ncbi:MAG: hypothetical protein AAF690_24935 [Acidobacteriota bacterium]